MIEITDRLSRERIESLNLLFYAAKYELHPTQINTRKREILENAEQVFAGTKKEEKGNPKEKELYSKIENTDTYHSSGFWILCSIRSEEHTSELQSLMRISYDVFSLKKRKCTNKIFSYAYYIYY